MQYKSCWCSNAAPGDTTDTDDCDESCPGYPRDSCGSRKKNLYGYLQLDKKPSTTVGGGSSQTTSLVSTFVGSLEPGSVITATPTSSVFSDSFLTLTPSSPPLQTPPQTYSSLYSTSSSLHSLATYWSLSRHVPLPSWELDSSSSDITRTILTTLSQTGSSTASSSTSDDRVTVTVTPSQTETRSASTLSTTTRASSVCNS